MQKFYRRHLTKSFAMGNEISYTYTRCKLKRIVSSKSPANKVVMRTRGSIGLRKKERAMGQGMYVSFYDKIRKLILHLSHALSVYRKTSISSHQHVKLLSL